MNDGIGAALTILLVALSFVVPGLVLAAAGIAMPGRRTLTLWAALLGVGLGLLTLLLIADWFGAFEDASLSDRERVEEEVTRVLFTGLLIPLVVGFVAGVVSKARSLRADTRKAPMAPLPPDLKIE